MGKEKYPLAKSLKRFEVDNYLEIREKTERRGKKLY